jgi:tRNA (mo5U34)-methyltransferase
MIVQACTSSHSSVEGSVRDQPREDARELIASSDFVWHQRFKLEDGIYTPGTHDIEWLMDAAGVPRDLSRRAVLDVGTSNGGAAFVAERRGAARVVALDLYPPDWFGFDRLARFLDSRVEYVQGTVYELPKVVEGRFDDMLFLGVLYHLRQPLLALDALRAVASGTVNVYLETAVVDAELPQQGPASLVRFYCSDELGSDASNWFAPTVRTLKQWCASSGYEVISCEGIPQGSLPERAIARLRVEPGDPEFERISYERSLFREGG